MTSNFSRCIKWKFTHDEYEISPNQSLIIVSNNETSVSKGNYYINQNNVSFVCIPYAANPPPVFFLDFIFICSWLISVVSLLISIILDCRNKTFKCWSIFYHKICLIVFYTAAIVFSVSGDCDFTFWIVRYLTDFAIIAAFCWVTVFNWEVWKKFCPSATLELSSNRRKLSKQFVFAWGIPTLVLTTATVWTYFRTETLFDRKRLQQSDPEVIFSNAVAEIILVINLILFVITIRNIRQYGKIVVRANAQIFKQLSTVYLKLMIVTGVTWIIEVLDWILSPLTSLALWSLLAGLTTGLQGFFLFLVYHFKILRCKYCQPKPISQPGTIVTIA